MTESLGKLLIIDDESSLLFGLQMILRKAGYEVVACNDSQKCVDVAALERPDLVICDVMMPVLNGYQVKEKFKGNPATANTPFIFLSARTRQTDKLTGLDAGADDYVTKPFDPRELLARIKNVLGRYEKGHQAGKTEIDDKIEEIRTQIIRNISHELRTPLTQILLSLEMVLRDKYSDPDELGWLVETAFSQSTRLNTLIDDMIYLSSHESGQINVLRQEVDVIHSFMEPVKKLRDYYADKQIKIQIYVDPGVSIHVPRREFRQATMHIIDNAFKFSPPMTSIRINLERNGTGGFMLTVSDYGSGIPQELREAVFERFYQIDSGDTRDYNGLGIGLTIARFFARSFGGDVEILDIPTGCTVRMTIPPGPINSI